MGAAGKLPQRQGVPSVEQNARPRQAAQREQLQHRPDRQPFERHHGGLHGDRRLGYARDQIEDDLRGRRVHRRGIVGSIHKGINRVVAQARERRVVRNIKIWIDAGGLHAAVPDIAEEVGRNRRSGQEQAAHGNADDENGRERAAAPRALRPSPDHEPCRDGVRHALEQEKDADFRVVEVRNPNCAGGRKHEQASAERQKRPIEPGDAPHSAAPFNGLKAKRSSRSEASISDWINARVCRGCAGQRSGAKD